MATDVELDVGLLKDEIKKTYAHLRCSFGAWVRDAGMPDGGTMKRSTAR